MFDVRFERVCSIMRNGKKSIVNYNTTLMKKNLKNRVGDAAILATKATKKNTIEFCEVYPVRKITQTRNAKTERRMQRKQKCRRYNNITRNATADNEITFFTITQTTDISPAPSITPILL